MAQCTPNYPFCESGLWKIMSKKVCRFVLKFTTVNSFNDFIIESIGSALSINIASFFVSDLRFITKVFIVLPFKATFRFYEYKFAECG